MIRKMKVINQNKLSQTGYEERKIYIFNFVVVVVVVVVVDYLKRSEAVNETSFFEWVFLKSRQNP